MEVNACSTVDTQANRVDPYEAAPAGAASYGSTLFAKALLGGNGLITPFPHTNYT